jgi:acid phosphatase class B
MAKFKNILNNETMIDRLTNQQQVSVNRAIHNILIDFQEWKNKVAENDPMALETDNEDIVLMYMNDYYRYNESASERNDG